MSCVPCGARVTSGCFRLFISWPHLHSTHIAHWLPRRMERAKPQKDECTDGRLRAIVRLERCGYEVEGSGCTKPNRRPVCARDFADVAHLCSTDVEALSGGQSRQHDSFAGSDRIRYYEIFRAFLNELRSSEESITPVENRFTFDQEAV